MRVYCLQLDLAWEDKPANYAKARAMLAGAHAEAGSLVLLPEMFPTGFSMNVPGIAETPARETEVFLADLARKFGVFVQGGQVTLGTDGKGRNESVTLSPRGELVARYTKLHPFSYGGESKHYTAGENILHVGINRFSATPFICYDLRFPEAFRLAVRGGTTLYSIIACWPASRAAHWEALLRARAIENQAYVAAVNRVGADPHVPYAGRSMIVDPRGEIVADAGGLAGIISARLDLHALQAYRQDFPALADIRPEFLPDRRAAH